MQIYLKWIMSLLNKEKEGVHDKNGLPQTVALYQHPRHLPASGINLFNYC